MTHLHENAFDRACQFLLNITHILFCDAGGAWAGRQPLMSRDEQSGLQMPIALMGMRFFVFADQKLTASLELEAEIGRNSIDIVLQSQAKSDLRKVR
jgi:hypothetical protein